MISIQNPYSNVKTVGELFCLNHLKYIHDHANLVQKGKNCSFYRLEITRCYPKEIKSNGYCLIRHMVDPWIHRQNL